MITNPRVEKPSISETPDKYIDRVVLVLANKYNGDNVLELIDVKTSKKEIEDDTFTLKWDWSAMGYTQVREYILFPEDVNLALDPENLKKSIEGRVEVDGELTSTYYIVRETYKKCESCKGEGIVPEHDPDDPHEDGCCNNCPIPVQCNDCLSEGKILKKTEKV